MFIYGVGSFYRKVEGEPVELKDAVREAVGRHVRRIDRFTQLALIGSHQCTAGLELPSDTSLYLASGTGSKGNITTALTQVFRDHQPLMPLNFINMVGNSASFYVAKTLDVHGPNVFITDPDACFESAIKLALVDFEAGAASTALVGCIDESIRPVADHRRVLGLSESDSLGEGTHWLYLSREELASKPMATVAVMPDKSANEIGSWLAANGGDDLIIATGNGVIGDMGSQLEQHGQVWAYRKGLGYYKSIEGFAVTQFLTEPPPGQRRLIHIDRKGAGEYNSILVELFG